MKFSEYKNMYNSLYESLDRAVDYTWQNSRSFHRAFFEINGKQYVVVIQYMHGIATAQFGIQDGTRVNYKATLADDSSTTLMVFATVIKAIEEDVKKYQPFVLKFEASDGLSSRTKLYNRMIQRFAKQHAVDYTINKGNYSMLLKSGYIPPDVDLGETGLDIVPPTTNQFTAIGVKRDQLTSDEINKLLMLSCELMTVGDVTFIVFKQEFTQATFVKYCSANDLRSLLGKVKMKADFY